MATATENTTRNLGALSQWQLISFRFSRHKLAVAGLNILIVLYGIALFAEFFAPHRATFKNVDFAYCPPTTVNFNFKDGLHCPRLVKVMDPVTFRRSYIRDVSRNVPLGFFVKGEPYKLWGIFSLKTRFFGAKNDTGLSGQNPFYLLGADKHGRDILSRILYGSRISLSVGLIGITFTFCFGLTIGGVSGYIGGATDTFIQRCIEIINAFPQLPLWLALGAAMPADWSSLRVYFAITLVLSFLNWTGLARVVRGKILSLREEDYTMAARLLGAGHRRILFRHLIPGMSSHIIVALTLSIPAMILGETSLSFLGLGLRPPVVSWGVMLQDCMDVKAVTYYPWLLTPVLFVVCTVLSLNFLGDGLRDAADPYSSR